MASSAWPCVPVLAHVRLGHELYLCLLKETGGSEEAVEQPVTWGWRIDTVFIASRFALRDQQWELPRSTLRLNLFCTVREN